MKIKSFFLTFLLGSVIALIFLFSIKLNLFLNLPIFNHPFFDLLGTIFISAGLLIHLSSVYFFKTVGKGTPIPIEPPKKLVLSGLYKFTRNPMYLGVFCIILGGFFIFGHILLLIYAFLFLVVIHFYVVFYEEPKLIKRFGQDYINYRKFVPRWIPKIKIR